MRVLLNVVWLVLAGWWLSLAWLLVGVGLCASIIGLPFGLQAFKIAGYALWPFGSMIVKRPDSEIRQATTAGNVVWVLLAGWWLALVHAMVGLLLMLTVVGIPLAAGVYRMLPLTFAPFGREIVGEEEGSPDDDRIAMPRNWSLRPGGAFPPPHHG